MVPPRIPNNIREEVIRRRIRCESFDKIAAELGISHGAAADIERQWRNDIGASNAQAILDLASTINRLGISPKDCAEGAQIRTILNELGVIPEITGRFLSDLAGAAIAKGMAPNTVANILLQMTELSQKSGLPLEQVPDALESACKNLVETEAQIADRASALQKVQTELQSTLDEMHTTRENVALFLEVQTRLKALGLSFARINDLVNVIHKVQALDNDPVKIAAALSPVSSLRESKEELEAEIQFLQESLAKIEQEITAGNAKLARLRELQTSLDECTSLGFTPGNLHQLLAVVKEVSSQREIPLSLAAGTFLTEVTGDYDRVLGYRGVLSEMERQVRQEGEQLANIQKSFAEYTDAINSWKFLNAKGVREKDLIYWHKIFQDHPHLSPETLSASLRQYAELTEAIVSMGTMRDNLASDSLALRADNATLQKEKASALEEIERIRRKASDNERQRTEILMQMLQRQQAAFNEIAADAVKDAVMKAVQEGVSLGMSRSLLLPLVLWENGGPRPQSRHLILAGAFVLNALMTVIDPTDPLKKQVEDAAAALRKRVDGSGDGITGGSNSSGSGGSSNSSGDGDNSDISGRKKRGQ